MFTGLVQCLGRLLQRQARQNNFKLVIAASFDHYQLGESIAVNGVCLTVTDFSPGQFSAILSIESAERSNLASLALGSELNLEKALKMGDPLGGHWVSGHVDSTATLTQCRQIGEAYQLQYQIPTNYAKYLVEKGSIAVDGASLTINRCDERSFELVLIPHSKANLHRHFCQEGWLANIEVDILSKYVEKLLACRNTSSNGIAPEQGTLAQKLKEAGFL